MSFRIETLQKVHDEAMGFAEEALLQKSKGNYSVVKELYRKAFEKEKEAALAYASWAMSVEPNRTILLKSAAVFAKECDEFEEAERLIARAFINVEHEDLKQELRILNEKVNFHRHLNIDGVELAPSELQISLFGDEVSYGMVALNTFTEKVKNIEALTLRKFERKFRPKDKYRTSGKPNTPINFYLSTPRNNSYAVTIRIGGDAKQMQLFEEFGYEKLIDEILQEIEIVTNENYDELRSILEQEKVEDKEAYIRNVITLVSKIAPDKAGKIKQIGFSVIRKGKPKTVSVTRTGYSIRESKKTKAILNPSVSKTSVSKTLTGKLDYVYGPINKIAIVDERGISKTIKVPKGLEELVKEKYGEVITILTYKNGDKYTFVDIIE